jgi:ppGpp synthetase/RelA/SpoT-type nucleotidyltranferase
MNVKSNSSEGFDFNEHKNRAIQEYQSVRPLYEECATCIKNVLDEAFKVQDIKVHSIESRAKELDSFGKKASMPSPTDPNKPHYLNPMSDITDLSGTRVIVFLPRTLNIVDSVIQSEFEIIEKTDKTILLIEEAKFGYASIHYLVKFKKNRAELPEYSRYKGLVAEIQVRTILQHAWAEIEHDIQYKAVETIPSIIRRRFMSLAGMLEIADREFQAIQDEDERLRQDARKLVRAGRFDQVEITPNALKTYLDKKLGIDNRMTEFSYVWATRLLHNLGFTNFEQVEECINSFDDDELSRIAWGSRQGQLSRFENLLLAGMGENYSKFHSWKSLDWYVESCKNILSKFKNAGIKIGSYLPPARRE